MDKILSRQLLHIYSEPSLSSLSHLNCSWKMSLEVGQRQAETLLQEHVFTKTQNLSATNTKNKEGTFHTKIYQHNLMFQLKWLALQHCWTLQRDQVSSNLMEHWRDVSVMSVSLCTTWMAQIAKQGRVYYNIYSSWTKC